MVLGIQTGVKLYHCKGGREFSITLLKSYLYYTGRHLTGEISSYMSTFHFRNTLLKKIVIKGFLQFSSMML